LTIAVLGELKGGEMEYGEIFARLMERAIRREEYELMQAKASGRNSKITQDSVHIYGEYWIWPAFLKEALRDPDCPRLDWEKGKPQVDCLFLGSNGETIASFELKPLFQVHRGKGGTFDKIIEDFSKQWKRAKESSTIEYYVVLIPYGSPSNIATWENGTLLPTIKQYYPDMRLQEIAYPNLIELNRSDKGHAVVKVFRITSASNA
jgi:hypothetical protein